MKLVQKNKGFSAVELLITLFIATTFLIAGFQLYSTIIKDGGSARLESRANNIAYDYLQKYKANTTNPCTQTNPLTNSAITIDGLSSVTVSVAVTCPYTSVTSISKVTVTINYNGASQPVVQATYVDGSDNE